MAVNNNFTLCAGGRQFDPATVQLVLRGPGCPNACCILSGTGLQQATATRATGVFKVKVAGTYTLNVRNGATGPLSQGTARFTIR
jgi:hypothetical protein